MFKSSNTQGPSKTPCATLQDATEMKVLLKATLRPNLRRKRRLCSSSETDILLRNDITVASTSIEVLVLFHLLNTQGET